MGALTIVGVGPGSAQHLTGEARRALSRGGPVFALQTEHPLLRRLAAQGRLRSLRVESDAGDAAGSVAAELLGPDAPPGDVVYATPGDPLTDDRIAIELMERARERGVAVRLVRGISLLDTALVSLQLSPPPPGLQIVEPDARDVDPSRPALVVLPKPQTDVAGLRRLLARTYPAVQQCTLFHPCPPRGRRKLRHVRLAALGAALDAAGPGYLYLAPLPLEDRLQRFDTLREIVAILRAPGGCPWDREQTHASIKENLLEESYEALEALDSGDPAKMREEFGDLLMQIMLHAQMAEEVGAFDVDQIIAGISAKLIRRHPHVFGSLTLHTAQDVVLNWEVIKRQERAEGAPMLASVPRHMPALAYAQAVQKRAARVGFDWPNLEGVLEKVAEEIQELRTAANREERQHEVGDLLFALVNLARWLKLDAEEALRLTNQRFYRRFAYIEDACRRRQLRLGEVSLEQLDALWEEAKRAEAEETKGEQGQRAKG